MITDLNKILVEWAYRTNDGKPDVKNNAKLLTLESVLKDFGWSEEARAELLFTLMEQPSDRERLMKQVIKYKNKDGEDKEITVGGALKQGEEHPAYEKAKQITDTGDDKQQSKGLEPDDFERFSDKNKPDDKKEPKEKPKVSMSKTIDRGGDSEVKNLAFKYGFREVKGVFKPAPGNAGSLLNEVVSGEVAQMIEEDSNLSDEELIDVLYERFGETQLFKSKGRNGNSGSKPAAGIKMSEIPDEHKKNAGLYSKVLLAVRSGRRKHKKAIESANKQNFENPKMENYYGHSSSFDAMVNDIKDKQVIGPNGEEISQEEAEELIRSGGGGDNPSDTGTLVFDEGSNKVIMLFHSDKDSTDAIVAQSSANAEAVANEQNIDKLVEKGKITEEQAEAVKGENRELVDSLNSIEKELKQVVTEPGTWFLENTNSSEVLEQIKSDKGPDGEIDKNKTSTKLGGEGKGGAVLDRANKPVKRLHKYLKEKGINPNEATEEQSLEAFFEFMGDENKGVDQKGEPIEPTGDQVTLMERLNSRHIGNGAPDIFSKLEDIRNRTLQAQRDFTKNNDEIKLDVDGQEVGLGTFLEGGTIWKQFHLEAVNPNSNVGVHKYPGMFETNHGGLAVDGKTLTGCMGGDVNNKNDFISRLEVGDIEDQKGVSGTQKGRTTGGKRIVYAITAGGKKIEVGQKTMRTKAGKTGKLATDYKWSKDMKDCFAKEGNR